MLHVFSINAYVKHVAPVLWSKEHNLDNPGRSSLHDATYQITRL